MSTGVKVVGPLGTGPDLATAIASYYTAQMAVANATAKVYIGRTSISPLPHAVAVASGSTLEYTPFRDGVIQHAPGTESTPGLAVACGDGDSINASVCSTCGTVAVASSPVALQSCSLCGSNKMDAKHDAPAVSTVLVDGIPLVSVSGQRQDRAKPNSAATIGDLDEFLNTLAPEDTTATAASLASLSGSRDALRAALRAALASTGLNVRSFNRIFMRVEQAIKDCKADEVVTPGSRRFAAKKPGEKAVRGVLNLFDNVVTGKAASPANGTVVAALDKLVESALTGTRPHAGCLVQPLYALAFLLDTAHHGDFTPVHLEAVFGVRSAFDTYLNVLAGSLEKATGSSKVATASPVPVEADMSDVDLTDLTADTMLAGCRKPKPTTSESAAVCEPEDDPAYIAAWGSLGMLDDEYQEEAADLMPEDDDDDDEKEPDADDLGTIGEMGDEIFTIPPVARPIGEVGQMLGSEDMLPLDMLASAIPPGTPGNPSIDFTYSQASGSRPSAWWVMSNGMPVAVAHKDTVAPALRSQFDTEGFKLSMSAAVSASTDAHNTLVGNGFRSHQVLLPIAPIIKERVSAAVEEAYVSASSASAETTRKSLELLEIGLMGMEKQYYTNTSSPWRDALLSAASGAGIAPQKMASVIDTALQSGCLATWISEGYNIATQLQTQPQQVIDGTAIAIASAPYKTTAISGYAVQQAAPQAVSPMLPVAPQSQVAVASAPAPARPVAPVARSQGVAKLLGLVQ